MAANDFEFAKIERDTFPGKMSTNKKKCCSVVGKRIFSAGENYSVCVGINIFWRAAGVYFYRIYLFTGLIKI